jgi:hypothetical protein
LNGLKDFFGHERIVGSRQCLVTMAYLPGIKRVVQDVPDRGVSEQSRSCNEIAVTVRQPLGVPSAEPLVVEPGGEGGQSDRSRGISGKQCFHRLAFFGIEVDASGMLGLAGKFP